MCCYRRAITSRYYLFRSWGRTGTGVGRSKTERYASGHFNEAKEDFKRLFEEKSGNRWGESFKKLPGMFDLVDMDCTPDDDDVDDDEQAFDELIVDKSKSTLAIEIRRVISLICNTRLLFKQMREFELDTKKMPLGKLSRAHILRAYTVLKELEAVSKQADRCAHLRVCILAASK